MGYLLENLTKKELIHPPKWLVDNCCYLTMMGSQSYGVATASSDWDIYGFCIPPRDVVFPHLAGEIIGFGKQLKRFEQWQEQHIFDKDADGGDGREYDFSVYNIVKFFNLAMEATPNILDALYAPLNCVLYTNRVGNLVREQRKLFLHAGCMHKLRGYSYSQLSRIKSIEHKGVKELIAFEDSNGIDRKTKFETVKDAYEKRIKGSQLLAELSNEVLAEYYRLYSDMMKMSKRSESVKIWGMDLKFAYHTVRLVNQAEQILSEGDLDLTRSAEQLKSIRRGEWSYEQIIDYFKHKEKILETLYANTKIPKYPDEDRIKRLLLEALESHYSTLKGCIVVPDAADKAIRDMQQIIDQYKATTGA